MTPRSYLAAMEQTAAAMIKPSSRNRSRRNYVMNGYGECVAEVVGLHGGGACPWYLRLVEASADAGAERRHLLSEQ